MEFFQFGPRFYQICSFFCRQLRKLASVQKVLFFQKNVVNAKFEQRDGHGKLRSGCGKIMEILFAKSVGTLVCLNLMFSEIIKEIL